MTSTEQNGVNPEEEQISGSVPKQKQPDDEPFFIIEDEEDPPQDPFGTQEAAPFQLSNAMPTLDVMAASGLSGQQSSVATPPRARQKPRQRRALLAIVAITTTAVVVLLTLTMTVFAAQNTPKSASAAPQATAPSAPSQPPKKGGTPTGMTPPAPTTAPGGQNVQATTWVPGQLPDGWTKAGLLKSDAVQALYTGMTFTEREMELDFRNAGTRANHGGTFTAAAFLLTPAAKTRFAQNDVRVINNALFDRVAQQQMIEAAVDATPKLVNVQVQGNQQFAMVDVAFHLWQSRIDPNTGQRQETLDMDQNGQPRIHHMSVLLLRVAPERQGPNAPLGGLGWLVSNYGLDQQTPVVIVEPA